MTYISGLTSLLELTKEFPDMQMEIHSDRAGVYASKDFNALLPIYDVVLFMSCAGTPTGNVATETSNELDQGRAVYGIPCDGLSSVEQERVIARLFSASGVRPTL